jgi:DNA-binding response OmpR family regulator
MVVEDEDLMREAIAVSLRAAGYVVIEAGDAEECLAQLAHGSVALVVLDLGLPGATGFSLAQDLRRRADIGLVVVSRRSEPETRIEALDLGVDDYLVKPIHFGELAARVRSVLRRRRLAQGSCTRVGRWLIDIEARTACAGDEAAGLTRGEFDLLAELVAAGGKIVGREELLRAISRAPDDSDLRSVDALISRIRRKLGGSAPGEDLILTAPGFGYRLSQSAVAE